MEGDTRLTLALNRYSAFTHSCERLRAGFSHRSLLREQPFARIFFRIYILKEEAYCYAASRHCNSARLSSQPPRSESSERTALPSFAICKSLLVTLDRFDVEGRSLGHSQVDRQRPHNVEFIVHVSPLPVWLTPGDTVQAPLGGTSNQQIQGEGEKGAKCRAGSHREHRPFVGCLGPSARERRGRRRPLRELF